MLHFPSQTGALLCIFATLAEQVPFGCMLMCCCFCRTLSPRLTSPMQLHSEAPISPSAGQSLAQTASLPDQTALLSQTRRIHMPPRKTTVDRGCDPISFPESRLSDFDGASNEQTAVPSCSKCGYGPDHCALCPHAGYAVHVCQQQSMITYPGN